jgi:hypothetical protein
MGTPEGHQNSMLNTSKVKKNKDTYGIYPTTFAGTTQNPQKNIKKSTNQDENFSKKSMFSTLKKKRSQKFVPYGICRLNPKS